MNVLIKNMEMPTRCAECWLMDGEDSWCCACRGKRITSDYRYGIKDRPEWCPLVPVPPHGDLIDRDALIADLKRQCEEVFKTDAASPDDFWITRNQAYNERLWTTWCESLFDYLKAAPIIEAEEGE